MSFRTFDGLVAVMERTKAGRRQLSQVEALNHWKWLVVKCGIYITRLKWFI